MAKKASASANKAAVIREALGKGIEAPAAISAYAKQSKGLEIDPKYVSVIKSNIRAKEKGGRGRRGSLSRDAQKEAMMFALKNGFFGLLGLPGSRWRTCPNRASAARLLRRSWNFWTSLNPT